MYKIYKLHNTIKRKSFKGFVVSCSEQPEIRCSGVAQRREAKLWTGEGTALQCLTLNHVSQAA